MSLAAGVDAIVAGLPIERLWVLSAAALVLAALAWAAAIVAGRRLGPPLAAYWREHAGLHNETLGPRMCDMVRHGVAAALIGAVRHAYPWPDVPLDLLALAGAVTMAMLAGDVMRGLAMPPWLSISVVVVAFAAVLANGVGGYQTLSALLDGIGLDIGRRRFSLLTAVNFAVIFVVLFAAVRIANRLIHHTILRTRALDATQRLLFEKLAGIAVVLVAFFLGIDLLGIDLTALAVFSGAFGLAIGFGLQKTFGNLIAGIILLMDRSIKPGDVIVVGDSFGWVNKIGVRAVSILTRDGKEHLIPNENLMTQEVENWSFSSRDVRLHIPVSVSYACDIHLAQKLMMEAANASKRVLPEPRPTVWLRAFGEGVEHEIRVWIADPEQGVGNVQSDVLNRVWDLFREHGIDFALPQREVLMRERPAAPPVRGD